MDRENAFAKRFKKRLIARIDTKNNKVVKGIEYEGYSVVGDIKYFTNKSVRL